MLLKFALSKRRPYAFESTNVAASKAKKLIICSLHFLLSAGLFISPMASLGYASTGPGLVQLASISIEDDYIVLSIHIAPGPTVAHEFASEIDLNGDGAISEDEAKAFSARLMGQLSLKANTVPIALSPASATGPMLTNLNVYGGAVQFNYLASLPTELHDVKLSLENRFHAQDSIFGVSIAASSGATSIAQVAPTNQRIGRFELVIAEADSAHTSTDIPKLKGPDQGSDLIWRIISAFAGGSFILLLGWLLRR